MKRRERAWPKQIVEVVSTRPDPRADPALTQKISRDVLEDALRRTKSGTRRIRRDETFEASIAGEPKPARQPMESLAGPRDSYSDAPVVTTMGIESTELHAFDPQVIAARRAVINTPTPVTSDVPPAMDRPSKISRIVARLPVSPRTILVALLALVAFMASAGLVGFLAGRAGH